MIIQNVLIGVGAVFSVAVEKRLVDEVRKNDVLIIVGETGSGKTTRRLHFVLIKSFLQCYL